MKITNKFNAQLAVVGFGFTFISQAHAGMGFAEIVASWFSFVLIATIAIVFGVKYLSKSGEKKALKQGLRAGLIIPPPVGSTQLKNKDIADIRTPNRATPDTRVERTGK